MPLYLDRHDVPGTTPEELAAAHERDLEVQASHDVKYHTYWFDEGTGAVFCLAEGPTRDAVEAVHMEAHGLVAASIIEIDPAVPLNSFLGPSPQEPPGTPYTASATRAIVFTDLCGSVAQTVELGDEGHLALLREHDQIVRSALTAHEGREVKHTGDGIMSSFESVAASVAFAIAVQRRLAERNGSATTRFSIKIGISAGEPVTGDNNDLFGAAVQLAARLCDATAGDEITVSVAVRELCIGKSHRFEPREPLALKGFPEPVHTYAVLWRE
jgi:class 3 adenylate cyclase